MERRHAAMFAADVVGCSRFMGLDELGTLAALKAHRKNPSHVNADLTAGSNSDILRTQKGPA